MRCLRNQRVVGNRHEVFLFKEATGTTTTWKAHFYGAAECAPQEEDGEDGGDKVAEASLPGASLVEESGKFCLGPKEKVHAFLDVGRYTSH